MIGNPDPQRTELIKAFVVLSPQYPSSSELAEGLQLHVRQRLAAHAYPREMELVEQLPIPPVASCSASFCAIRKLPGNRHSTLDPWAEVPMLSRAEFQRRALEVFSAVSARSACVNWRRMSE